MPTLTPRSRRVLVRAVAAFAALAAAGTAFVVTRAEAKVVPLTYSADSGDRCLLGKVQGTFAWLSPTSIKLDGNLVDKPYIGTNDPGCADDKRHSVATFIAYVGTKPVDTRSVRADNAVVPVAVALSSRVRIDRVTVQVCRHSNVPTVAPVDYCGSRIAITPIVIA